MKTIAIIYTVRPVLQTFPALLQEVVGQPLKIHNLLDEFLASDPGETGVFSIENRNRLFNDIKSCELTGADLIIVTCSTLTPAVQLVRPFIKVPVVAIDDAMAQKAVSAGTKLKVVATANSTVQPTIDRLNLQAREVGKTLDIDAQSNEPAYAAMRKGDLATHDKLVLEDICAITGYDAIVLAQASMAHLQPKAEELARVPVFATPRLCCEAVRDLLMEGTADHA